MKNIQLNDITNTFKQAVLNDIHHLRKNLGDTFENSDLALLENLFSETRLLLDQALDDSKTKSFYEKYTVFSEICEIWFKFWQHYKDDSQAAKFIHDIDDITNRAITYMRLCLSVSLINENKTNEYQADLEKITRGYFLLSETIDVFSDYISISELKQVYNAATNVIAVCDRDLKEFFKDNNLSTARLDMLGKLQHPSRSNLVTQLRASCSLIILNIEKYIKSNSEKLSIEDKSQSNKNYIMKFAGVFEGDLEFEAIMTQIKADREGFSEI